MMTERYSSRRTAVLRMYELHKKGCNAWVERLTDGGIEMFYVKWHVLSFGLDKTNVLAGVV